jgi:catechol 2,3-dioxygenase-like lactoylglutathione lyase family enzyme
MAKPDMIGIVVKDMAKTLAFYRELGLDIPAGAEKEEHVEVKANGYRIAWDAQEMVKGFNPDWAAPNDNSPGRIGLAFLCENAADVDATFQRLMTKGYRAHKAPWDAVWGQRYAQVLDPDGNAIDLFAPL